MFIGIDWSDTKHDICIQPAGNYEREFDRIVHQPKHIDYAAALSVAGRALIEIITDADLI